MPKKTKTRVGSVADVRKRLWEAVEAAATLTGSEDPGVRLRAVHAVTQAAGAYSKIVEACEFESRIAALESQANLR